MKNKYYKNITTRTKTKVVEDMVRKYDSLTEALENLREILKLNPDKPKVYKELKAKYLEQWITLHHILSDNGIVTKEFLED